jgi:uncharacterized OsmC-like protein
MELSAHVRTVAGMSTAVGWAAGGRTLTVDRPWAVGGRGLGFNGGELLLLAVAGCFHNDVLREAPRFGVVVRSLEVEVRARFVGDPIRARDMAYEVQIDADGPRARIDELLEHVDRIAEVHNSLRCETPVTLARVRHAETAPHMAAED